LTATAVASNQVYLAWPGITNAVSYNLKRSTVSGSGYTLVASDIAATACYDSAAVASTTYYYVVSAINGGGESANSTQSSATTPAPSVPAAPKGLTAAAGTSQILLNWIASIGASSYTIKRAANGSGSFTNIATGVAATYTDTNVIPGTVYYYVVTAVNANGESDYSAPAIATLAAKLTGIIIGTAGSFNNGGNTITKVFDGNLTTFFDAPSSTGGSNCWAGLDFGAGTSNVITQIRYCPRATFGSRMINGIFQGANDPAFTDPVILFTVTSQPPDGVMTVQAVNNTNAFHYVRYLSPVGGWGNVAEVEFDGTPAVPAPPVAPTGLKASAGDTQVTLNWSASAGATGYNVKSSTTNGGSYSVVASNLTGLVYTNMGLTDGVTYYYVVSAANSGGESPNSLQVSAMPVSLFPPPLTFSNSGNQLQLGWPVDHLGWTLEVQTNSLNTGLGTNWVPVTNSTSTNQMTIQLNPAAGNTFFRLVYLQN